MRRTLRHSAARASAGMTFVGFDAGQALEVAAEKVIRNYGLVRRSAATCAGCECSIVGLAARARTRVATSERLEFKDTIVP